MALAGDNAAMRTFPFLLVAIAGAAALVAQARPTETTPFGPVEWLYEKPIAAAEAQWTLWVAYPNRSCDYRDHATYLADLQVRYGDRGLRVAVGMPAADAHTVAGASPGVSVFALPGVVTDLAGVAVALTSAGDVANSSLWSNLDGMRDRIEAALGGNVDPANADADQLVDSLLNVLGDGGDHQEPVAHCLLAMPTSGRAHAAAVLFQWWCKGDLVAAQQAVDGAMRALADESVPLCTFADFALRGDRTEPRIARTLAMALAPAAAAAPDGVFTQLVYLRALRRAGLDRLAGRVAAGLPKLLGDRPLEQLWFAETLMDGADPAPFRDLADQAVLRATELAQRSGTGIDRRLVYGARYKIQSCCGDSPAAIATLLQEYRGSEDFGGTLNNDAWYMVTQPGTMGRFDALALAQAEAMLAAEGDGMAPGNKDTVALVLFCNGRIEPAVELQTEAVRASNRDPEYVGRLTRYENALAAARAAAKAGTQK